MGPHRVVVLFVSTTVPILLLISSLINAEDMHQNAPVLQPSEEPPPYPPIFKSTTIAPTIRIDQHQNYCETPICREIANNLSIYMDRTVDPCDDFYAFACGRMSSDPMGVKPLTERTVDMEEQLRMILEEDSTSKEIKIFRLAKKLYKICMKGPDSEPILITAIGPILKRLGGWPVLESDQWNDTNFDFVETAKKFLKNGYQPNYFFDLQFEVWGPVAHISSVLALYGPRFPTNGGKLLDVNESASFKKTYIDTMVHIAWTLGARGNKVEKEIEEALDFRVKVSNIYSQAKRDQPISMNNIMTIDDMSKNWPNIPWMKYITMLIANSLPGIEVDAKQRVFIYHPMYITNLVELLKITPKKVQMNYFMAHVISQSLTIGKTKLMEWRECVRQVVRKLLDIAEAMYIQKYPNDFEAMKYALEMTTAIKSQFKKNLQKAYWIDEETRKNDLKTIELMKLVVGTLNKTINVEKLNNKFKHLELDGDIYLDNMLKLYAFQSTQMFIQFGKPFEEILSTSTSDIVNYNSYLNTIQIPEVILKGELFNKTRPRYMNYGVMGSIIGHEISHGFDDSGIEAFWWTESRKEIFFARATCIINQYNNYSVSEELDRKINGEKTRRENMADNVGFKMAYYAYREWAKQNEPEVTLPGLPYTPNQMFWISAAHSWCESPDTIVDVENDLHSPSKFRILGSFSNIREFAEDFNCPLGSNMNPEKKCIV